MEITERSLWTLIHGMGFGALYLLACSGALVDLYRRYSPTAANPIATGNDYFLKVYLVAMSVLAWLTVLTGAYIIYPWYRAAAPAGAVSLAAFPQRLLQSNPATSGWHSIGMEWKEHVAWLAPISITMAAAVVIRYGRDLRNHPQLRAAVLYFTLVSFLAAGIGSFMVALLAIVADKSAVLKNLFVFYKPTGALSGVTTVAIFIWLIAWVILEWRWRKRNVALGRINAVALVLLCLSLLLTFPPFADLF